MREVALVVDEYGNEIFFGETIGECRTFRYFRSFFDERRQRRS